MKTLLVDCGATKAAWYLSDGTLLSTPGFNLAHTPPAALEGILDDVARKIGPGIDRIHFYAAGLVGEPPVDLRKWFPQARVEYASDMLAAARAVCGKAPGIAAILGTGANSCEYDGEKIVRQVKSGGYILGDEGSASVLGKNFLADYLKGRVPDEIAQAFEASFDASYPAIVRNVYRSDAPARYLGSIAPFLQDHYDNEYVKELVDNNFRQFFERAVRPYSPLPLGIVGGFGYVWRETIKNIGQEYGVAFSGFLPAPMDGLKAYHGL